MPLNVIKLCSFRVAETILHDSLYNPLLKLRCVALVWYSFCHNKAPHLLSSISYCLTNGVLFKFVPYRDFCLFSCAVDILQGQLIIHGQTDARILR